jgi:hypothetical protein
MSHRAAANIPSWSHQCEDLPAASLQAENKAQVNLEWFLSRSIKFSQNRGLK